MLQKVLVDYAAGRFYSTVLVLLTVIDGFVNDLDTAQRKGLHARSPEDTSWAAPTYAELINRAGPVAVNEAWSHIRTDSAHPAVLWISEWPRSMVYPGFLSPILLSSGIQRSFSLICTPMRSDQAARDIRKKKVEHISDQAQRAKIGQIEDASQIAEYHDVLQQEADLTAGHGILRYTGLITITATTIEDLDAHVAALEQAAIQANCETRLLAGQQAKAFTAAALPLCRQV